MIAQERLSSADALDAPRFGRRGGFRHRPHPGGHRGIRLFPSHVQYVYPESYPVAYGQSVEDEVNSYVAKNECIVLRRGADDTMIRREVVNALKARGWEERVDVQPRGGFNEKTLILCPPAATTASPLSGRKGRPMKDAHAQPDELVVEDTDVFETDFRGEIQGVQPSTMFVGSRRLNGLGRVSLEGMAAVITAVVIDRYGKPMPGVKVYMEGWSVEAYRVTDMNGRVSFGFDNPALKSGQPRSIFAVLPEGLSHKQLILYGRDDESVTVNFQSTTAQGDFPAVTTVEKVAIGGGIALTIIGALLQGVSDTLGDILLATGTSTVAAGAFSAIQRKYGG